MKIAILADPVDNQNAGIQAFTINVIKGILKHRGDHEIIVIKEKKTGIFPDCEEIAIPNIKAPVGFATLRLFFILPLLLRRLKVDVVIEPAHFGPFNLPSHIKRVTIIHDLTALIMPDYHRWHSQLLQRLFLPLILRKTDLIVTNSAYTKSDVQKHFPNEKDKVTTILLGKDNSYFPDSSGSEIRSITKGRSFFHYLGTIEPRKDLNTLLNSYQLVREQDPAAPLLLIAGEKGWKTKQFFDALEVHPYRSDIRILGRVSKKVARQLHTQSLSMIYPSLYEGFGLPILECFSCGGRVIISDNTSLPEVGGHLAQYFKTGDHMTLASKMILSIHATYTDTDRNKAIEWSNRFSWDKYVLSLLHLLERP